MSLLSFSAIHTYFWDTKIRLMMAEEERKIGCKANKERTDIEKELEQMAVEKCFRITGIKDTRRKMGTGWPIRNRRTEKILAFGG